MKYLLIALSLVLTSAVAFEDKPSVDFVKSSLEFCTDYAEGEENKEKAILECVNEEMSSSGYTTFESLQAVKDYIEKK